MTIKSEPLGDISLYATGQNIKSEEIAFEFDLKSGQPNTKRFQKIFECEGITLQLTQERPVTDRWSLAGNHCYVPTMQSNTVEFSGFSHCVSEGLAFDLNVQTWQIIILTCLHGIFVFYEPRLIEISRQFEANNRLFIGLTLRCFMLEAYPVRQKQKEFSPYDIEIGPRSALPSGAFDIELENDIL